MWRAKTAGAWCLSGLKQAATRFEQHRGRRAAALVLALVVGEAAGRGVVLALALALGSVWIV